MPDQQRIQQQAGICNYDVLQTVVTAVTHRRTSTHWARRKSRRRNKGHDRTLPPSPSTTSTASKMSSPISSSYASSARSRTSSNC